MFTLAEIRGNTLHWLLELRWAGLTIRLAERDVEAPPPEGGDDVQYHEGLQWSGSLPDPLALLKDTAERKQARLILHMHKVVDVPALIADGHVLGSAVGRLMLWPEGRATPVVVIDGRLRKPTRGLAEQPVVGMLEEMPARDQALWPPVGARIDATSWPNADEAVEGEYYPSIFGGPGGDLGGRESFKTPAYYVDTGGAAKKLLIAGHRVLATQVRVRNTSLDAAPTADYFTVVHGQDGRGRTIAYIDLASPVGAGFAYAEGDGFWVSWFNSAGTQQFGLELGNTGTPLRRFVDVLTYWLERSSVRWDRGRVSAIGPKFAGWLVDTYVQASPGRQLTPFAWIQSQLLPNLPVSPRIGPEGLHFVPWEMNATAIQAVAHIRQGVTNSAGEIVDWGNAAWVEGEIASTDLDSVSNEVAVSYDWNHQLDKPLARRVLTGSDQTFADDDDADLNYYAQRGLAQYGQLRPIQIKAPIIQDTATAGRFAEWKLRRAATQQEAISYRVEAEVAALLTSGDPVLLTHTEIGYTAKVALVVSVEPTASQFWFVDIEVTPGAIGTAA